VQRWLDENPQAMRQRLETVEHPFGTIKMRMGATHFLMKRLKNVRTEMAFAVLAYNLTRVMNIIGIKPLMAAFRAKFAADHAENRPKILSDCQSAATRGLGKSKSRKDAKLTANSPVCSGPHPGVKSPNVFAHPIRTYGKCRYSIRLSWWESGRCCGQQRYLRMARSFNRWFTQRAS
jgi:transposase